MEKEFMRKFSKDIEEIHEKTVQLSSEIGEWISALEGTSLDRVEFAKYIYLNEAIDYLIAAHNIIEYEARPIVHEGQLTLDGGYHYKIKFTDIKYYGDSEIEFLMYNPIENLNMWYKSKIEFEGGRHSIKDYPNLSLEGLIVRYREPIEELTNPLVERFETVKLRERTSNVVH